MTVDPVERRAAPKDGRWVICTPVGAMPGQVHYYSHYNMQMRVPVWTAALRDARFFSSLGDIGQVFSVIPDSFKAFDESIDFL